MNVRTFLSLITGLVVVVSVVGGLYVYRDHRDTQVLATSATLQGASYDVGIDYTGVLIEQRVERGQFVHENELLGLLNSAALTERMLEAGLTAEDLPYPFDEDDNIELRAASAGIIRETEYTQGSFVPASRPIYQIVSADQYYVTTHFNRLSRAQVDMLDLDKSVVITYKDGTSIPARMLSMEIDQVDTTTYDVELEVVPASQPDPEQVIIGEPLDAVLVLQEESLYSRFVAAMNQIRDMILRR